MKRGKLIFTKRRVRALLGIDGSAAVEFAMTAPVLVLLGLGVADFGVLMGSAASLESAARAGVEVAKVYPSVTAATLASFVPSGATTTVASVCTCVDGTPSGGSCPPGPFDTPCAGKRNPFIAGNPVDPRVFEYVSVTVTQSVSPMVSYASFGFFPSSLRGEAFTRTQ